MASLHWAVGFHISVDVCTNNASTHFLKRPPVNPYAAAGQFGRNKIMQKTERMNEILAHGYLSESTR